MNLHFLQKKQHFGIRKFSIGVVSVALAISFSVAGGQVAAAQEASQTPVSSQQTSQAVTDQANQLQETNEVTVQIPETVGSSLNQATQENPAQESQLVEVEPAIQKEVVSQDISAPQAALSAEAGQEQTAEEQSNTAGDESTLTVENSHQIIEQVEPKSIQTAQEPAGSTDEVTQPVQPTETATVEEVVQPVLRSARRARSVAAQELAKLPLDAQGQLMPSVNGKTVHQYQVVYSDGSSQLVAAQTTDQTQANSDISNKVNQIKQELSTITYDSLYPSLNNRERIYDKTEMDLIIAKENPGRTLTEEEKIVLRNKYYMDQLDMRDSFARVQGDLETILTGIFEKSKQVDIETIKTNKEKVLLGLTYLDRQFSFKFGNYQAKDFILYHPEVFGGTGDVLTNLYTIGSQNYQDLLLAQSATTFKNKVARQLGQTDVFSFVEKGLLIFDKDKTASEWLKEESKALIVEAANSYGLTTSLYDKLKSDTRLNNHLLPLLSLPSSSIYALSTSNTVTYGLTETYLDQAPANQEFEQKLSDYAHHQQEFLNFWYRMTEKKQEFTNYSPIIVVDTVQKYGPSRNASELYSPKFGSNVLKGVREFIRPLNLYAKFAFAGGQANGTNSMNNFLYKSLTDDGHAVYTHELTHMLDKTIWLNGFGRRTGQGAEVFARGLFESLNMSASSISDPIFNLNTAYQLGDNRTQNASPERFQTSEDLKTYMQGILDVLYTLDYAEAQSILKKTPEERAVLLNKISLIPNPANNGVGNTTETVNSIDTTLAASLTSVSDFVDQSLISGRYKFDGLNTRGTARTNSYYTIPLFEPIYAALQNDTGSGGDISFKRNAYEILGEYGYENGMVAYLSDQHANDQAALNAIMPEYDGNLAAFKKAMFARRIDKVNQLNPTAVATDFSAIQSLMDQAVTKDLAQLQTNQARNTFLSQNVNAVRELKNQIFQEYLAMTNDFQSSIYKEKEASRTFYVTNGQESSTEGAGTEANPYHSLSYALQQASDGDVIKLVRNVTHRQDAPFVINKAVTIDGQGHTLTFRGPDLELGAAATFTSMTLNMIPSGSHQPTIYLNGYQATFDAVSTTVNQLQDKLRPTIVAGARTGEATGDHAQLLVVNGDSNTRFRQIFAGNADSSSSIPVTITIDSEFAGVDEEIDLGGQNDQVTYGRVELISRSTKVKEVVATNSMDNQVTIKAVRLYGAHLTDIQDLHLAENADVTLSSQVDSIVGQVNIESRSKLQLDAGAVLQVGGLSGEGILSLLADNVLTVTGDLTGTVQIEIRDFEQNLSKQVGKILVTIEGLTEQADAVRLVNAYGQYALVEENGHYRLASQDQQPQTHTLTLRFIQAGQVLKSEQVQVVDGQSLANVEAYLPQAATGTYQLAPTFDPSVLTGISASQTIDIPVVLVIPATPILSFDKTSIQEMTLVQGLDKSSYQEGEILDLTGVRVRLVDQQGIALVIDATRFTEYGVSANPVGTPLLSSQQELTLTLGNHVLSLPIQVQAQLPSKASRFQPLVSGEVIVWPSDSNQTQKSQVLQAIRLPNEAGSVNLEVVGVLPTASGDYSVTIRVTYDDQSQEEVVVPLHILSIDKGSGVTHELPIGVLSKSDRYQPQVTGEARVLPASSSDDATAEIVKQISLPAEVGQVVYELVSNLPQTNGDYPITVRVIYDDRSQDEIVVPLHIFKMENGKGVTHELPIGVLPKSDRYQPQVTSEARVLPTSTSEATTAEILKQISLPTEVGQVDFEVVGSLPQSSGDYSITVRVVYDDRSQEEVAVPLHILFVETGKGVTHELPVGVLPKSDLYQAQVTGSAQVLPTSTSEATTAEILKQISLPTEVGQVDFEVVGSLPQSSGDYSITVRVVYDDRSQEEVAVPFHILFVETGKGVQHELPVGLLPKSDLYQAQVTGSAQVLPTSTSEATTAEILKQISLPTEVGQVDFEVVGSLPQSSGDYSITVRVVYDDRSQEEVAVPLHILFVETGKGVTHELPVGVLPKSDLYQAQVTGSAQVLPTSTSEATTAEILKQISLPTEVGQVDFEVVGSLPQSSGDYSITVRVVYDDRSQEEVAVPLHILFVETGKGVTHELPVGVLPPLETTNGGGVTHELPVGVLPPLETTNGGGVTHELPVGVLPPLETTNGGGVTHELPIGVLPSLEVALEKGLGENSPKPVAKEMAVSVSVVGQQKFAKGQLPKTGDRNNLLLVGVMLAIFNLIFWMSGKKPHQVEEK
ncbi:TPA: YSIRK-type signal peptide-containing protein [Streptococcus suis]|nr:YSIRK-type signal peptide-containing protein [Streptococcus suis]